MPEYGKNDIEFITWDGDPERCQANDSRGQCNKKGGKLPDGTRAKYCNIHGAIGIQNNAEKQQISNYQLGKWQARLERMARSPEIKSLRDEIGILRICMEERLFLCKDDVDFTINAPAISDLAVKIEKLVSSCDRIDKNIGNLLDKNAVAQFGGVVINIIAKYVTDTQILESIGGEILKSVQQIGLDQGDDDA